MYPTPGQEEQLLRHCQAARFVWNLAVEQWRMRHHRQRWIGFGRQDKQLTEARAAFGWLADYDRGVQTQALKDFAHAIDRVFQSGFGEPTWRKRHGKNGFRIVPGDRVPVFGPDGTPELHPHSGKQVHTRQAAVRKLNRRFAQVKIPGAGWVKFRNTYKTLPQASSFRVTFEHRRWHVAFAVVPVPIETPGTGAVIGLDRGVAITAALSDGQTLNCPQLTSRERARKRKHERRAARAKKNSPQRSAEYNQVARIRGTEARRRQDWVEKTSTMLARSYDLIRFEDLRVKNMTRSAKGTVDKPGKNVRQKSGLNRSILAQGWGMLRSRTQDKAPGRCENVPAPYTSLRCSDCGWIDKNSRKNQAEFLCSTCGFSVNADVNAAMNIAAGRGLPGTITRQAVAGGTTPRTRLSVREPTASTA